jgi:hypothetical protein
MQFDFGHDAGMTTSIKPYKFLCFAATLGLAISAQAAGVDFSGKWSIDLRSPTERKRNVECGSASFSLSQIGDRVSGSHEFATPGCGRLNEGGDGTVKGFVIGSTAVLVVTSGRNGAIVMGRAVRKGNSLHWQIQEEIRQGEPEGDSPLIFGQGILKLDMSSAAQ